ncbi:MAG: diadenylate cyclase CdaA [Treponemataceae bacterium]|nr:diadenylate cyclase CdaA [Treponemataceae bacterium]
MELYDIIRPIIDISILAFILYSAYEIVIKTQTQQIIKAISVIFVVYVIAHFLQLDTILWLLSIISPGIIIGLAVIFQSELKKIILGIGKRRLTGKMQQEVITHVMDAAKELAKAKRGMLVVFGRSSSLKDSILHHGVTLNADISSSLLVTIFMHDTPLHDGAVVIENDKLIQAGAYLPISEQHDIAKTFGTRHRAALGLSEVSDAIILIVSEETKSLSLAYDSKLYYDLTVEQITEILKKELNAKKETPEGEK